MGVHADVALSVRTLSPALHDRELAPADAPRGQLGAASEVVDLRAEEDKA